MTTTDTTTPGLIHVRCNLCGADDFTLLYPSTLHSSEAAALDWDAFCCTSTDYHSHFDVVRCNQCGLVYCTPRLDPDVLIGSYEDVEDTLYLAERAGRELTFRKHLRTMERFTGPGAGRRLLDVGAYIGVFVEVAQQAGWDVTGVEPSHWAVGEAQRAGLNVMQGNLQTVELTPASFDVVTMWDVIEHFDEPKREMEAAYRLLKPGGVLVVHTIDIGSPTARLMGAGWPFLMEMHIVFFSRATLRDMAERMGYEFIHVHTQGRYLRLGYLAGRLGAAFSEPLGKLLQRMLRALGLAGIAVPVNTFDLFTMYLRKPE